MGFLVLLGASGLFLLVMYFVGGSIERGHLASLEEREASVKDVLVTTLENPMIEVGTDLPPRIVFGEAVISSDYFKTWLFGLRNMFGGESRTFTLLFERARREATLRMIEAARSEGYTAICNVRFGSADLGGNAATNAGQKKTLKMAACTVTGTAYRKA